MNKSDQQAIEFSTAGVTQYLVAQHQAEEVVEKLDAIAEEVPIAFVYNGISHAVMLATPQDLEDFALGFSLAEGIINSSDDLYSIEVVPQTEGIALQLEIASECFVHLKEKRRSMTGRTGCGLCGSESLAQALRLPDEEAWQALNANKTFSKVNEQAIFESYSNISQQQNLQKQTGATHASAWVSATGEVLVIREDVGRHNALDKLVGAIKRLTGHQISRDITQGFILTTSRASYEMVQKTISAGLPMLVAISAPTGLAIRVAKRYGITLVGFARAQSYVVYCDNKQLLSK